MLLIQILSAALSLKVSLSLYTFLSTRIPHFHHRSRRERRFTICLHRLAIFEERLSVWALWGERLYGARCVRLLLLKGVYGPLVEIIDKVADAVSFHLVFIVGLGSSDTEKPPAMRGTGGYFGLASLKGKGDKGQDER